MSFFARALHALPLSRIPFIAGAAVLSVALGMNAYSSIVARIVTGPGDDLAWVHIQPQQVASGVTIPAGKNVMFQVPPASEKINRETLLGGRGNDVRYWGYCLAENYAPDVRSKTRGFPGKIFLSEKERTLHDAAERKKQGPQSIFTPPLEAQKKEQNIVHHQLEIFDPGSLCYIMTAEPLPIGIDRDDDGLNTKLEADLNTDALSEDTDGDGVLDGTEHFHSMNPTMRDTDLDNLIDGLEDKNFNGRIDPKETNPALRDTDRDGLCDGLCMVHLANNQFLYMGEDTNMNGSRDAGESNPLASMTLPIINDFDGFLLCKNGEKKFCFP